MKPTTLLIVIAGLAGLAGVFFGEQIAERLGLAQSAGGGTEAVAPEPSDAPSGKDGATPVRHGAIWEVTADGSIRDGRTGAVRIAAAEFEADREGAARKLVELWEEDELLSTMTPDRTLLVRVHPDATWRDAQDLVTLALQPTYLFDTQVVVGERLLAERRSDAASRPTSAGDGSALVKVYLWAQLDGRTKVGVRRDSIRENLYFGGTEPTPFELKHTLKRFVDEDVRQVVVALPPPKGWDVPMGQVQRVVGLVREQVDLPLSIEGGVSAPVHEYLGK